MTAKLKTWLRAYVPVTCLHDNATFLFGDLLRSNFIVNIAVSGDDAGCSLERMKFAVGFLNQAGNGHLDRRHMWINGDTMSSLTSFSRKWLVKFVYDVMSKYCYYCVPYFYLVT